MKNVLLLICLSFILTGFGQTNTQSWENAVYAVKNQNAHVAKTTIEFIDYSLSKTQVNEIIFQLKSKEEVIDFVFTEGKSLVVYHYTDIDDSGLKSLITNTSSNFNVVNKEVLTTEQVEQVYEQVVLE